MRSYFKAAEFNCKCGCGLNNARGDLMTRLNQARDAAGIPFGISSGSRCEKNNRLSGGAPDSAHLEGWAVDIQCVSSMPRYKIITALIAAGFTRIGISKSFIHADCDPNKPSSVVWTY